MKYANILAAILAVTGFIISYHIYMSKRRNTKLVCIIGRDCDRVVKSKYSKILGTPNEVWGMIYYAGIFFLVFALACFPFLATPVVLALFKIASSLAALSAVILFLIQAFVLKEWCEWCLGADLINILIFILAIFYF